MDQVHLYIKNIIALLFASFISWVIIVLIGPLYLTGLSPLGLRVIGLSTGFLVLAFLNFRITGERPSYLYGLQKSDEYLNKKGGFWLLFKWIFTLFGLAYDLVVWVFHGVYVLFLIVIDLLVFFKLILYWIIRAVLWVLKLFIPPIVFIYHNFIHYIIRWPWWIYKLSFRNIAITVNRNFYFIALWGAIFSLLIILLFLGVGILMNYPVVVVLGAAFAILPLVWSYGEIAALRYEKRENEEYKMVRNRFDRGFDSVKAVLFYFVLFLVFLIVELLFNLLGWIPTIGFSLLGISLNINSFISILLLFIFVIILFAKFMMPAHVVHDTEHASNLSSSVRFLGVIGQKFLRYLFAHIPGAFFSAVLLVIPLVFTGIAVFLTLQLKNTVIDMRISNLNTQLYTTEEVDKFEIQNQINRMEYFKDFPQLVFGDFTGLRERIAVKDNLLRNLEAASNQRSEYENSFELEIDSLQNLLNIIRGERDSSQIANIIYLENQLESRQSDYDLWKSKISMDIARLSSDLKFEKEMIIQLPIAFLFTIIWISIFGGIVLAVVIAYLGNVYFELYSFREDETPSFFRKEAMRLNEKDRNQPLLGFTLIVLITAVVILELKYSIFSVFLSM
jgi:hypothetical protein